MSLFPGVCKSQSTGNAFVRNDCGGLLAHFVRLYDCYVSRCSGEMVPVTFSQFFAGNGGGFRFEVSGAQGSERIGGRLALDAGSGNVSCVGCSVGVVERSDSGDRDRRGFVAVGGESGVSLDVSENCGSSHTVCRSGFDSAEVDSSQASGDLREENREGAGQQHVLLGPNGGVSIGRGLKYEERKLQRERRKEKKKVLKLAEKVSSSVAKDSSSGADGKEFVPEWRQKAFRSGSTTVVSAGGYFSGLTSVEKNNLVRSRASRMAAENRLAEEKAKRNLILLEAQDVEAEKKRQSLKLLCDTERNKVNIEKAFASLAATGNVPGIGGSAKTVVSGSEGSGTISPNSSVSMQEVRAMMQELESLRLENARLLDGGAIVRSKKTSTVYTADENGDYPAYMYDIEPNCGDFELREDGKYHKIYRDYVY